MGYSRDFKKLVIDKTINRKYKTIKEMAYYFNISNRTIYNWKKIENIEDVENKVKHYHKSKITQPILLYMRMYIKRNIIFSVLKLASLIYKKFNVSVSSSYIYDILHTKLNLTYKRVKPSLIRKNIHEHNRKVNKFLKYINTLNIDDINCLDETHFYSKSKILYGWSEQGKKIMISSKPAREKRVTVIATIGNKGIYYKCYDKHVNSEKFTEYLSDLNDKLDIKNCKLLMDAI
jgi:transposase